MPRIDHGHTQAPARRTAGQAITELAVFGAILIFLLGTIVRSAAGNSMTQNQNLKAMRMALLASWQGSMSGNTSRNSASVLIVEDRLSPDFNKYGDVDRNPYITSGSGTFTYQLLYPLTPGQDNMRANMPVMDTWINGQYFPFVTALYNTETLMSPLNPKYTQCSPGSGPYDAYPLTPSQCKQNQCLRNQREWVGGIIEEDMFENIIPVTTIPDSTCLQQSSGALQRTCQAELYAREIFSALEGHTATPAVIQAVHDNGGRKSYGTVTSYYTGTWTSTACAACSASSPCPTLCGFATWYQAQGFPTTTSCDTSCQLTEIQNIIVSNENVKYKLFYTMVANPMLQGTNQVPPVFSPLPPQCLTHPCQNQELSDDVSLLGGGTDGDGNATNVEGVLQYDLLRNAKYGKVSAAFSPVPPVGDTCATAADNQNLRCNIAWQWAATAATSSSMLGLNTGNNQFPTYDVDGRLKEQTIYAFSYNPTTGEPTVSFADYQQGDIDTTWDANSCSPKPGLQADSQIYSFTQPGTYLQIREGQMYNPETGQAVRSVNKRDTVDMIERRIQLSNNTGRFCPTDGTTTPLPCIDNDCTDYPPATKPNPVEVCANGTGCSKDPTVPSGPNCSCFSSQYNIKSTCMDTSSAYPMLYIRSRILDRRGNFWITNANGLLKVGK